jgi:predicted cobalt transporter CbtA
MAGLVPAIPLMPASCPPDRDHRDKPGDDGFEKFASTITRVLCGAGYAVIQIALQFPVLNGARGTPGN